MGYIIVWRDSHREPFVDVDSRNFKQEYDSYDIAKENAEEILKSENENGRSPWYFGYKIYGEVNS